MKTSDFYYDLPQELIAQDPLEDRSSSRLLVLHRDTDELEHRIFKDVTEYLRPGDCLVVNNTKVIPARLIGEKEDTGAGIEVLLLKRREGRATEKTEAAGEVEAAEKAEAVREAGAAEKTEAAGKAGTGKTAETTGTPGDRSSETVWETLVKPGKKARPGARIVFGNGLLIGEVLDVVEEGNRLIRFTYDGIFEEILDKLGQMPLPPYITHQLKDKNRYQTVYARHEGSAAAPTAGLHFTPELLAEIGEKGVKLAHVTLHVGLGTFRPVKVEDVASHHMHSEFYMVEEEQARLINETKAAGGRVICVGTTSCRTLESATGPDGVLRPGSGWTDIFIYPGYSFRMMDALITNFHLPESTLLMLVSAFAGRERMLAAYEEAVRERYRFFSFGDASLII